MTDIEPIITSLEQSSTIFLNLMSCIPSSLLKKSRIKGKWSIHGHACHLVVVQPMLIERFKAFIHKKEPEFIPYLPGKTDPEINLINLDLTETLKLFTKYRNELINTARTFDDSIWTKKAKHPEYSEYTAHILLRHVLMHDHLHMYRIEELWLTRDDFLKTS